MSTKIYEAYRIPKSKIEPFLAHVRQMVFAHVADDLERTMVAVKPEIAKTIPAGIKKDKRAWLKNGGERFNRLTAAFELTIESSSQGVRGFNYDAWLNCWPNGRRWYIVPGWPDGLRVKKDDLPDYVEEYGYWNNVDMPDDVTWRQWRARERKWEEVCVEDHNRTRFSHVIVEAKYPHIGLDIVERMIAERGPWPDEATRGFGAFYRAACRVRTKETR